MTPLVPPLPLTFTARVVEGAGRGRTIGSPTLNVSLQDVPKSMREGIYACRVHRGNKRLHAAMHFGPRPVFHDTRTCEIHIIDHSLLRRPSHLTVDVVKRIRNIRNFRTVALLQKQIAQDVIKTRNLLKRKA